MAEQRALRGWSAAEIADRLAALDALPATVDEAARDEMREGRHRWHPERSDAVIAREPPGPPIPGGAFERARQLVVGYRFSDPSIVRAHFDPARPLLGRPMLLEIQVLGLRYLCGTRVGRVRDEQTDAETTFGFRYDTLEGHIERGEEWFVLRKDHATGEIHFTIASRWRRGDFPNWWSRAGFSLLAGTYRARWLRRAHERMRARLGSRSPRSLALAGSIGGLSGARTMAGPWAASLALRDRADGRLPRALVKRSRLLSGLAASELLADQHPRIPPRVELAPMAARTLAGAVAGAAVASGLSGRALVGAGLGGAAALVATRLSFRLRARLATRVSAPLAGVIEDAAVGALALVIAAAVRRRL